MSSTRRHLLLGAPRFTAQDLPASDALTAWRQLLLARGPAQAATAAGGEFAVALEDEAGRVFLAVDKFAVHSLCYRIDGGQLRFAARADELADATPEIDPQAIFDYLFFHAIPSPRTIFKGVYRLPPGHYAWFENGQLSVAPYWQARFEEASVPRPLDELREEFQGLLRQAVQRQIGPDGLPACFLSGGTDSSTVAGMLARLGDGTRPHAYSIGFQAEGYDEMEFARIAARHFGCEHHEYYVTPEDLLQSIPKVAGHFDQPFGNSSALPAFYCAQQARQDGATRMLAGDGGDELFGGNSRYAKQRIFNWYQQIPGPLRRGLLEPLEPALSRSGLGLLRKTGSYVEQASVPMPDRLQMYNLVMRLGLSEVLSPAMLGAIDTAAPLAHQRQVWRATPSCSALNRELAFDWRYTLAESDLPKVVGATGLAGIGVGFPMLDDELLDFSLRLPTDHKLKGLQLRWFFKEALRGFLPDEIITKKKQGFGLPFGVWTHRDPRLQALGADSLRGLAARGVVRAEFVEDLLNRRLAEHPAYFGEMVWILTMLEQWLRAKAPDWRLA
ncbi:asparagine synthase [Roseateles sp. DAIF2]|uniref:asparagine synthetase B family protein n=1 Tax=Roseateles sp. DAIF2 TaxID=2714952 RepID=UPI0018A25C16|nr:asparagine synthase-related protein [Roseateles sp. DAIF2]QPF73702.1 asparagine synthase [Roseateles sp. DAIF2]